MTARRTCPRCGRRRTAITPTGRYWAHGRPRCPQSGKHASYNPAAYWASRYRGRRVITVPAIDAYNPKENAA